MIKGIGVDIESIDEMRKSIKNKRFLKMIFTENEIKYCRKKNNPLDSFCGKFCAKEAFLKAINKRIPFNQIEVKNTPAGKPQILIKESSNKKVHCSISHAKEYCCAFVVIEE